MTESQPAPRFRFGVFEVDAASGELRRKGIRIKLNAQPFQVLVMLLERPGDLLTREEISRALWSEGTFVDFEHGLNSAINRIREALGDSAASPRFVETLARRGYRFIAPVERVGVEDLATNVAPDPATSTPHPINSILATPEELPEIPHRVPRTLFLLLQLMYLGFYIGALANLAEVDDLLSVMPYATALFDIILVSAAILIPVRTFLFSAVLFRAPHARMQILRIWPAVLIFDIAWSLGPFLLLHHIPYGLAIACSAILVYSPFAQRSLILMGAASPSRGSSACN